MDQLTGTAWEITAIDGFDEETAFEGDQFQVGPNRLWSDDGCNPWSIELTWTDDGFNHDPENPDSPGTDFLCVSDYRPRVVMRALLEDFAEVETALTESGQLILARGSLAATAESIPFTIGE